MISELVALESTLELNFTKPVVESALSGVVSVAAEESSSPYVQLHGFVEIPIDHDLCYVWSACHLLACFSIRIN